MQFLRTDYLTIIDYLSNLSINLHPVIVAGYRPCKERGIVEQLLAHAEVKVAYVNKAISPDETGENATSRTVGGNIAIGAIYVAGGLTR